MNGDTNIQCLKGVGEKTYKGFQKLGVETVDSLITMYPKYYLTYEDPVFLSELTAGERAAVQVRITSDVNIRYVRGLKIVSCLGKDSSGTMTFTWFNMPYLKKQIHRGEDYIFVGTPVFKNGRLLMEHPEIFHEEDYKAKQETLQPVYPLTSGITNKTVSKAVGQTEEYIRSIREYLPDQVLSKSRFMDYSQAIWNVHFPKDKKTLIEAKKRLIFDEFFIFMAGMNLMKQEQREEENRYRIPVCSEVDRLTASLPYELTGAQKKALSEMQEDLMGEKVMNRLVQGDVGSGKTILAVILLLMCAKAGYQGVLMAPTEVLASQHYETFLELLGPFGISVALLTGSVKAKEKREIYQGIKNHEYDIVIGTHALIQDAVEYDQLALVITDEQHRFGVRQREILSKKGEEPHVLVMSATPIPRTLAIIMYGDLDVSIIDELPSSRLPIKNCVVNQSYRPNAYRFMERQVTEGRQVYIICPMVEESEAMEGENVVQYANMLKGQFPPSVHIGVLHGKMKPKEKQKIMEEFSERRIDILVSTTVIEVGVNVPNATVMMVENAERFGLAQLHQLRGRVGRGEHQSYCIFMSGAKKKETMERLEVLNKSNDGFFIANEDLKLRGPGDFFGVRQSGMMDFVLADIYTNADLLKQASDAVHQLCEEGFDFSVLRNSRLEKQISLANRI
ncbi:ATP-dependent DNA helicase RecG [Anaerostipes sp.]|uniref:ATP-dependent DNA helicase RecG n=1 Tax=Anaerostipes sp. TaxID=1872530 RepID=UPI0025C22BB0|nr:ATP-dependent DNA helicase RecG [Anaerostipes sp.]MBS7008226.1 ATP-dependent DNA helicase RecG [Anaerostipes sp.]